MVGSFNANALRLYEKMGYEARAQRDFISFPDSDKVGHWILMAKSLEQFQRKHAPAKAGVGTGFASGIAKKQEDRAFQMTQSSLETL